MKKFYISFGQTHVHSKCGKTYDKDCLAEISGVHSEQEAHELAMLIFDGVFHNVYSEERIKKEGFMDYFPRGVIKV